MTKKNSGGWKPKKISGKGKIGKIFHGVWEIFWNRGKSETGGNASLPLGMDAPVYLYLFVLSYQH